MYHRGSFREDVNKKCILYINIENGMISFIYLNYKLIILKMGRKRNSLGQFIAKDSYNTLYVEISGQVKLFKYFLVFLAISPWLFVLLFRLDIKSIFKRIIENIFGITKDETKKTNGFF